MLDANNIIHINVPGDADEHGRRLYTITLYKPEDLNSLYTDMEYFTNHSYIPSRPIPVVNRRPISVNTDYRLTEEEAQQISLDPRVRAVELHVSERHLIHMNHWTISSNNWDKSGAVANGMQNWPLLRCYNGIGNTQWGYDANPVTTGTVNFKTSGKNVDFVVLSNNIGYDSPEYAVNPDGTGGSRVVQLDWLQKYSNVVTGVQSTNNYLYTANTWSEHDHACMGCGVGNSLGFARDANIYTIGGTGNDDMKQWQLWDYVTYWHKNKPINPVTGHKNPTVANSSWGTYAYFTGATRFDGNTANGFVSSIRVGGVVANTFNWVLSDFLNPGPKTANTITFTPNIYQGFANPDANGYYSFNWASAPTSYIADIETMVAAGVSYTISGGNGSNIVNAYSADPADNYNDYIIFGKGPSIANVGNPIYINRGDLNGANGAIAVGATDGTGLDQKVSFSAVGTKIAIFAPGINIMGTGLVHNPGDIYDYRNPTYVIGKVSGTSVSAPIAAGVIACLLETYPTLGPNEVLKYLQNFGKNQLANNYFYYPQVQYTSYWSLVGAANNYLYFNNERSDNGDLYPKENVYIRPSLGQTFPRPRIKQIY